MHGDTMSYAPTFKEALAGLVSPASAGARKGPAPLAATSEALERARHAFDEYRRLTSEGRFEEAGAQLRAIGEALSAPGALTSRAERP
jgi:uncharacterized membrane protein (UPF0182 family)